MSDLPDWLQAMRGRREQPRPGPLVDPQVTARLRRDFSGDAFGQMGRDFRAGFNNAAASARQSLPRGVLRGLSNSGVPGWEGLLRERGAADALQAGLQPPAHNPPPRGTPIRALTLPPEAMVAIEPDQEPWRQPVSTATWEVGRPSTGRGVEPASAPRPPPAMQEANALRDAVARTQAVMAMEDQNQTRRLPRPGQPLIAQAWSDPNGGSLTGGLVGLRGRKRPNPASRTGRQ